MRVQAGADCGAAERNLPEPVQRDLEPRDSLPDLRRVAAEFLAEGDRDRIHQVRPPCLDDVIELARLGLERLGKRAKRRQQVIRQLVQRREMHCGGKDVVRGLAHVDVVVRMDVVAGQGGDHLVRVHVRRGAGAGLEDVNRELVVELAGGDTVCCRRDPLRLVRVEEAELCVDSRCSGLDSAQPACNRGRDRLAGDREVLDRLARLVPPELLPRLRRHGVESRLSAL